VVALENADTGITCNAVCPGWVYTPLVKKQIEVHTYIHLTIHNSTTIIAITYRVANNKSYCCRNEQLIRI
jgi:NAD(P)-dependent dehydrogenase (short-subunit alcohol dehydrogenase family)